MDLEQRKRRNRTQFRHRPASFGLLSRWQAIPAQEGYYDAAGIELLDSPNNQRACGQHPQSKSSQQDRLSAS